MLTDTMPLEALRERYPDLHLEQVTGIASLPQLVHDQGAKIYGMGLHQWDRLVSFGPEKVHPMAMAKWVQRSDPDICAAIGSLIGRNLVLDIAYFHATVLRRMQPMTVAEMMVAHLYPGDLHLADIEFSDPDQPIPPTERKLYQTFRGLGLLGVTVDRLMEEARARSCRAVTLTAASTDLMHLFARHGFVISNTQGAQFAIRGGGGYPMERPVAA